MEDKKINVPIDSEGLVLICEPRMPAARMPYRVSWDDLVAMTRDFGEVATTKFGVPTEPPSYRRASEKRKY